MVAIPGIIAEKALRNIMEDTSRRIANEVVAAAQAGIGLGQPVAAAPAVAAPPAQPPVAAGPNPNAALDQLRVEYQRKRRASDEAFEEFLEEKIRCIVAQQP